MNGTVLNQTGARLAAPRHLWLVGGISLIWNAYGTVDYSMTNMRSSAWLAQFPAEMMALIDAMPWWAHAAWAFGVWGALAGSLLLLARSRHAVAAFAVSLAGLALSTLWQQYTGVPASMDTAPMRAINLAIWVIAVLLLVYARRQARSGVLR